MKIFYESLMLITVIGALKVMLLLHHAKLKVGSGVYVWNYMGSRGFSAITYEEFLSNLGLLAISLATS